MGECHCSNIAIMQLFHELKQQFPALPDHIVSQCIAQNSHDREICARTLRATQESRPSPGAFPPPAPDAQAQYQKTRQLTVFSHKQQRCPMNYSNQRSGNHLRSHRPASLDIELARRPLTGCSPRTTALTITAPLGTDDELTTPSSAPAACPTRGFFDESPQLPVTFNNINDKKKEGLSQSGFELNVNVACSPAGSRDFCTIPQKSGQCKRSDLIIEPRPHYTESPSTDHTRSYTSVSLTLRPPSSEPQPPIDIRSQGSSLTYSTSSLDPRGFQSRLQISIGAGSVTSARIKSPMASSRPNSLLPMNQTPHRPQGLPAGPPSQLPRPTTTTTMSAPTTPSIPLTANVVPSSSLPNTPSIHKNILNPDSTEEPQALSSLNQVTELQRKLVEEQLARKEKLSQELRIEKGRLEAMKKELRCLARPLDSSISPQDIKRKLRSEIYQLQVECDRLAEEVDQQSDPRVPLGETNEEFYQGIYTGQPFLPGNFELPPPLPSQPPAWQPLRNYVDREEREGPSWVCRMCTFDNHPLMNKCEQCDMPRLTEHRNSGETQDIHIRVTHHHNFSPRQTIHSWVV